MLQKIFRSLVEKYSTNTQHPENFWTDIQFHYSEKGRYYHTLNHLQNLLEVLKAVKTDIEDWDVVLFALFYHDIIYKPTSNNNEEKSGEFAQTQLTEISFPEQKSKNCCSIILTTKTHTTSNDNDTNYFTDADLSILGQSHEIYIEYTKQVRKEYSIYPDILYNPGRKKVLQHFLQMDRIFKTEYFFNQFEKQARKNLCFELQTL